MRASTTRTHLYHHLLALLQDHDVLALPSAQVWPFERSLAWPKVIVTLNGTRAMDTYHRWMEVVTPGTLSGCPVISLPVGFDARGLPMGMQIIGRPRDDLSVLQLTHLYESLSPFLRMAPPALRMD